MSPDETIAAYQAQARRRLLVFLIATVAGLAVALPLKLWTDISLKWWEVFIFIHGVTFWPWFLRQTRRGDNVSLVDVRRAVKEKQTR